MSLGSLYWTQTYGIQSEADFQELVKPYWYPSWLNLGLTSTEGDIAFAWDNPFSLLGDYAQAIVAAHAITGGDQAKTMQTSQSKSNQIQQAQGQPNSILGGSVAGIIVPGVFQGVVHATSGGQDVINVVGLQNSGGTAAGAAAALQTAWKVSAGPLSQLSSLVTLVEFRAMDLSSANGALATIADTTAGSITTTNALSTAGASALVKWNGGTRSASSRGRLYFGPLMEQSINPDGRTLATGSQTNIATAFANFRASLSSSGYPLVVVSRKLSQAFPVSGSTVASIIATQRRRIR